MTGQIMGVPVESPAKEPRDSLIATDSCLYSPNFEADAFADTFWS